MEFSELGIKEVAGKTRYSTQCPQCNESRQKHKNVPCLTVNNERDNRWWHCNHCGWSGNLDISDKFRQVQEKSRMPKQIAETYSKEVRDYLEGRGIEPRTAIKERVYEFTMASKPIIGFPFYMGQTLVNVKYFDVRWQEGQDSPKWWQMKKDLGTKSIFLGMQSLTFDQDEKKEVIITEGEWDWLTWKQCGHKNVLSVPMGAPNSKAENFEHEFDYANDKYVMSVLQDAELIIFSTDNDDPGRKLRDQLALIFGRERCKYINYPSGCKDINEVFAGHKKKGLKAQGKAGVDECYQNLSSFPINGVIRPTDVKDELELIASNGFVPGYGIGVERIDDLFTLKRKMFTVLTGLPGSGKALDINTPIPTINGFKPMGEICIGDVVFDENGKKCNVINATDIMYNHPCYKITFSDHTEIIADAGHLWETETRSARMSKLTAKKNGRDTGRELRNRGIDQSFKREVSCLKTTEQIAESLYREHGKRLNHSIKIAEPIQWNNNSELLLDPYLLGVWLGDGGYDRGEITSADIEVIEEIRKRKYEIHKLKSKYAWGVTELKSIIRKMGLYKNKHIPINYLYNSVSVRTEVLMGLMDTDGSMDKKKNVAEFCSTNKNLAEGVYTILCSLGMSPVLSTSNANLYGRFISLRHRVTVRPIIEIFKLKRKLENQDLITPRRINVRLIKNCIKVNSVAVKCIEVDSPSKLFLCSKACIPTHNSVWVRWYLAEFICHNEKNEFIKWAMFTPENRPVSREQAKLAEAITGQSYRRGYKNSMSEDVRSRTLRYIQQHFFFISPNKMNYETWGNKINQERVNTMDSLMQYLIYLKKTENIFGFVIDAWNKIEHEQPKGVTDTNFISQQLDHLINFIDVWDLHCILIAHPTKIEKVGINYRMPMLYDIKGSSAWKEKPDIGIILHRYINKRRRAGELPDDADEDDKYYMDNNAPTIVKVEKIRFEEHGHPGRVKMRMDYAKGGRFFLMEDTAPKPDIAPLTGKLNPAEKDEPDEVFNGDKDETKGLPF